MILLIMGKGCAGKTYFREYMRKKGIITYEASDYIKKAKNKYEIESTRELLDKLGNEYAAKVIYDDINNKNILENDIVISGFRTLEEVDYITNRVGKKNTTIVVIEANNFICYLRNLKRNRKDKKKGFLDFYRRQKEDALLGFDSIIKKYPVTYIKNNSSIKSFEEKIQQFISSLIIINSTRRSNFDEDIKVKTDIISTINANEKRNNEKSDRFIER